MAGRTLKSLFDHTTLGGLPVKNRFVRSATRDGLADGRGRVTQDLIKRYQDLARGGVGTVITGHAYVTEREQSWRPGQMGVYDDSLTEGYRSLTTAVKAEACRIILQVSCSGSQTSINATDKLIWGPSPVADRATGIVPTEMRRDDIRFLQGAFAAAARRAQAAGFDGVQLHAAHGYLLSKFLNPFYNQRTDEYGGTPGNRARMLLETYAAMRTAVGEGYPLLIKINCEDFMAGGMTFAECRRLCRQLDVAGVAAIEISGGSWSSPANCGPIRTNVGEHPSYFQEYAAEIARLVKAPVVLVGGNRDFDRMAGLLNSTAMEFLALCRPLICQPDLIGRWRAGDLIQSRCVSCNRCLGLEKTRCVFNSDNDSE